MVMCYNVYMATKRKRPQGNPARQGWEPLEVGPARNPHQTVETAQGIPGAFYATNGMKHWYNYREGGQQPATACLAFHNRLYNGFALVFEDGSMHLSFKRNDRAPVRDWRHFQAIKNEVAGPDREAIEIYPPEWNLHDAANEYHLWVLPPDQGSPMGFEGDARLGGETDTHDHSAYRLGGSPGWKQRAWEPGLPTGLNLPGAKDLTNHA